MTSETAPELSWFILAFKQGGEIFIVYEATTLEELLLSARTMASYEADIPYEVLERTHSIYELPNGTAFTLEGKRVVEGKLSKDDALCLARRSLAQECDLIGPLGKYFYRYKALHYGGLFIYAALGIISIWFFIDSMANGKFSWGDLVIVIAYTLLFPSILSETREVHDIWHRQKLLDRQ